VPDELAVRIGFITLSTHYTTWASFQSNQLRSQKVEDLGSYSEEINGFCLGQQVHINSHAISTGTSFHTGTAAES